MYDTLFRRSMLSNQMTIYICISYLSLTSYIYFSYLTPLQHRRIYSVHPRDYCARISVNDSEQFANINSAQRPAVYDGALVKTFEKN